MLKHGESDASGPLGERVQGVEVEEVSILASCGDGEDVLQRLDFCVACRQCLDLSLVSMCCNVLVVLRTILIEASARLTNVGATSPSWPAASSAAASHRERTVPTSCAKHSVQFRSALGLPSVHLLARLILTSKRGKTHVYRGH